MTQSYDAKMDEVLAAVDRLQSNHNLSLMATAAMQSAMRARSAKIDEMRDKVVVMEGTVADLKCDVHWMCENMKNLGTHLGVPEGLLLGAPP